jgi:Fuc2NAc and GlcNAc transferase
MAFVVGFLLVIPIVRHFYQVPLEFLTVFIAPGLLVAGLGCMDDYGHLAAKWRFLGHFIAALIVLYSLDWKMPAIDILGWTFSAYFANILGAVFLVWLINLYNFMDGIDGLAAFEAITVCLGGALLYGLTGHYVLMALPLFLMVAVLGFLYWNFPPACIFMGDAGSGFLGIVFGCMALQAGRVDPALFWGWLILLGFFVVDATVTLVCRAASGLKIYEAHRSHAYQHASRYFKSHLKVTIAVQVFNLLWLLPIAAFVGSRYIHGWVGLIIAYVPLVILAVVFKAGRESSGVNCISPTDWKC